MHEQGDGCRGYEQGSGGQRGDTLAGNDLFRRDAVYADAERRHADRAADLPGRVQHG